MPWSENCHARRMANYVKKHEALYMGAVVVEFSASQLSSSLREQPSSAGEEMIACDL